MCTPDRKTLQVFKEKKNLSTATRRASLRCSDVSAYLMRSIVLAPALHIRPHPSRLYSQAQRHDGPAQDEQADLLPGKHYTFPWSSVHPQQVNDTR